MVQCIRANFHRDTEAPWEPDHLCLVTRTRGCQWGLRGRGCPWVPMVQECLVQMENPCRCPQEVQWVRTGNECQWVPVVPG